MSAATQETKSVQCDYENEFTSEDDEMAKELKFKNELLELKETGEYEKFWKQAAEVIREDLSTYMAANEELSNFSDLIKEESDELEQREANLIKLTEQASEILNLLNRQRANEAADDSGITHQ